MMPLGPAYTDDIDIAAHSVLRDTIWNTPKEVTILYFLDLAVMSARASSQMACHCADGFLAGRLCCSDTKGLQDMQQLLCRFAASQQSMHPMKQGISRSRF